MREKNKTALGIYGKILILLVIPFIVSSCIKITDLAKVVNVPLDKDEKAVNSPVDITYKFLLPRKRKYEINICLHERQTGEVSSDVFYANTAHDGEEIFIRGKRVGNTGMNWSLSSSAYSQSFIFADRNGKEGEVLTMAYGIGSKEYFIEDDKENVLVFVIFTKDTTIPTSISVPFSEWANFTNKKEFLDSFEYVYIITFESVKEE